MSTDPSIQREFARCVLDAAREVPEGVTSYTGPRPKRRFDVYRNNVYVSLVDVLAGRFPVVLRLVGEDFFRAVARVHVEQSPPRSPVLMEYGEGFPAFLEGFGPAQDLPYLPDVARVEWAWNRAYHAADRAPLTADDLAAVAPDDMARLVLELLPSLGLVSSPHPVFSIWSTNTADAEVEPVDLASGGEDVLVLRPHLEVQVRRLPEGGFAFLSALAGGACLAAAFERSRAHTPDFDLQASIAGLIGSGAISGYRVAGDAES